MGLIRKMVNKPCFQVSGPLFFFLFLVVHAPESYSAKHLTMLESEDIVGT